MRCALENLGGCRGVLQGHHVCEQRWIKDRFPLGAVWSSDRDRLVPLTRAHVAPHDALVGALDLLADERNLLPLCEDHHEAVTKRRLYVDPPGSVFVFAAETGLLSKLEKQIARRSESQEAA